MVATLENRDVKLLTINDLHKTYVTSSFFSSKSRVAAVDDISFSIRRGETVALVGESGSGKSTLARCMLRLIEPTGGEIFFDGSDLLKKSPSELRTLRRRMQMVFQDPFSSLNPRMTSEQVLRELLSFHRIADGADATDRIRRMMDAVGLTWDARQRYPHEFSGGQRQRIGIARALILQPEFLVCDEAVSALDVSVRAQILNLLGEMKRQMNLTMLFISHDMAVVRQVADSVAVMIGGQMVEWGMADDIFHSPQHPYTQMLLASVPSVGKKRIRNHSSKLDSTTNVPGCRVASRCPHADSVCRQTNPEWRQTGPTHWTRCHFVSAQNQLIQQGKVPS